ncbi:MAG: hypothetical protein PHR16_10430 [Methylovulum sp.]|nr:hypothetical protein [Methylovulum sp.]
MNTPFSHCLRNFACLPSLLMIVVFILASAARASPDRQDLPCPSAEVVRTELTARKANLDKLKSGLEDFMTGKRVEDIPLTALFMIDLNDDKAVAQRVQDLQDVNKEKVADPFLDCAVSMESVHASVNEVLALQRDITNLRLQFLTLPADKRTAILHPQIEATAQANTVKQLQEEHSSALEDQQQAAQSLAKAEEKVLTTDATGAAGDLISGRAELERSRSALTALQVKWVADLEQQVNFYQETSEKLVAISQFLLQPESSATLKTEYDKTVVIWRDLVDRTSKVVSSRLALSLPPLPAYPEKLLATIGQTAESKQYIDAYAEAKSFRDNLQDKIATRLQETVDLHYRVLLQSGEIRSQLLNQLLDRGDYSPLLLSTDLLQDIQREFTIVPYRWTATFYLRSLDIHKRLSGGWEGVAETALNLSLLIGFLLIPWLIWVGTQRLNKYLNHLRITLVRQSRTHPWASSLAMLIQKILPYSPWLVMLVAVYIAQELLSLTLFSELVLLLPYLRYYIYYRLFRQLMQCDFIWVNQQIRAAKLWDLRRRVDVAAKVLGLTALVIFSFLAAIESLIRRGLIYHLTNAAVLNLGFLIIMAFAYQWRGVIGSGLGKLVHGTLGERLSKLCGSRWGLILAIPALLLLVLLLFARQLAHWGSHFEVVKRIAAEVFRYQLESAIEKTGTISFPIAPPEYRKFFTLSGIDSPEQLILPVSADLVDMRGLLKNWAQESTSVHSLAIVAYKGAGKTCLLDYLEQNSPTGHVIRASVPPKLTDRAQVLAFFSTLFNVPLNQYPEALQDKDTISAKTLVLLDDAHNFFLATQGGLAGYDTLLEIISQSSCNVFWCLAYNHHAWGYLNSVYDRHQYFDAVVRLSPWSEQAVQKLILSTHTRTAFRLSYDDIIQAVGSQNNTDHVTDIENRFFSLLRQQSRGNPRLAIYLWLTSLRLVGDQALRVGLPDESEMAVLSDLPEDALFVFASITRHENLTLPQVLAVTQLPQGAVRHVLELGVRLKLLDCQEGLVYRLAILYQYPLINYLQAKHCLYE